MGQSVDKKQQAETIAAASVSTLVLSSAGPANLLVSGQTALASLPLLGEVGAAVSCSQYVSAFNTPVLDSWHIIGINGGNPGGSLMYVVPSTVTTGEPCTVQFELRRGAAVAVTFSASTPEQNANHYSTGFTRSPVYMGLTCDLWWRWWSGSESADYALVCSSCVPIPGFMDDPTDSED